MRRWCASFGRLIATAALLAAVAAPAAEPGTAPGVSAARIERLSQFLRDDTQPGGHLGAVAVVVRGDRVVYAQAFGHRDLARRDAMRQDSIFRIYSMSKPIASVALLMLMEEGRLTLDDPVSRHLPEFAGQQLMSGGTPSAPQLRAPARPLTLRHLLTHTAGFATRGDDPAHALLAAAAPSGATTLEGYARRVAAVPLAAEPGTRFAYDGVNTEVMSRVVEVVAGQPFEQFLQQRLFTPLGMKDTGFSVPPAQRHRVADLSAVGPGGTLVRAPGRSAAVPGEPLNAYPSGAGGLYATAADYLRFARLLLGEGQVDGQRLLARKTVVLMRSQHLAHLDPIAGLSPGEGFGLGVSVVTDPARRGRLASAGAYGWSGAATTYFTVDPQESMIALLLMQHLPRDDAPGELPKPSVKFHNLVYQALEP
jgi:CubicO group peptidase (beta-lactamase class C family)